MKISDEKGITITTLVITTVLIIILASIGVDSGKQTVDFAKYTRLKEELKILQSKVNDLNSNTQFDVGVELTERQKQIFSNETISNIIFNGKTQEEQNKIINGFKFCDSNYIKTNWNLDSIEDNYFINVEYRYVIHSEGIQYKGKTYYMIDQFSTGVYNVQYNNKNAASGNYNITITQENDKWKVEVSDIEYSGYISNWTVKYKLAGNSNWKTSDKLTFYIYEAGNYNFKLVHGDEVDLGNKYITIVEQDPNGVNEN